MRRSTRKHIAVLGTLTAVVALAVSPLPHIVTGATSFVVAYALFAWAD